MTINFLKKEETFKFIDSQGNTIERTTEIRVDPLTGESSRLVLDGGLKLTPPDYTELGEKTSGPRCPFCTENLLKMTPIFTNEIAEEGRIFQGEATLFPNLFPYSKHNGVCIFSNQHYVRLEEFSSSMIKDAFKAAQTYIERVRENDAEARYASINWNYLPNSGGSILHPHIQVLISDSPTNSQALVDEKLKAFEGKKEYFTSLYEVEKAVGERWIGEKGNVAWVHAFAPKGHNDYIAIFREKTSVDDILESDWEDFAVGLKAIFGALNEQGYASFNMALNLSMNPKSSNTITARLIPRFSFGALDTSDANFFHTLHQEPLTYNAPEDVAVIARKYFKEL
jgi:UDPglucose--hexose-1-phosphate uridylyltransferase